MTPVCSSLIFNNDQYFAYLVKNFKSSKGLKIEQLNKLGYIYLECYEAFKIQNSKYGITIMKIQKLTSNLCTEKRKGVQ